MESPILITGGAGYIGSHAVKYFLEKGKKVVVLDNLYRGYEEAIGALKQFGDLEFHKVDLLDAKELNKVFDKYDFEGVLHFAALCLVTESMEKPEQYFKNNFVGTLNLLESMKTHGVNNLVFSSTCAVYGESEYLPLDEKHPTNPTNPYGESKLLVEKMIKWYGKIYGLNFVIFRYFNVCGASDDGIIGDSKKPSVLLIQNAVRGALNIEPFKLTCSKVDTPDGTPIRDYVDVVDLARAHYLAYEYLADGGESEEMNLGTGKGFSVKEIVDEVDKLLGVTLPREFANTRKGEYAQVYASLDKARNLLGWKPEKNVGG